MICAWIFAIGIPPAGHCAGHARTGACGSIHSCAMNPGLRERASRGMVPGMQPVTERLRSFLQYVAVKLIDDPGQAQLKVAELGPKKVRFKLVLSKADVAILIGRNGFTASSIRNVLKAAADKEGVQVLLQIHSHEEEAEMQARGE